MKNLNHIFTTILVGIACLALSQITRAAGPQAPATALANGNTADGDGALAGLTTGFYNSAFGFLSLLSNGSASFNTGVGAGSLLVNTAGSNTAIGAGALLSNSTGEGNTASGTFALFTNTTGSFNTAVGDVALLQNTTGAFNSACGQGALGSNTIGNQNTAIGGGALFSNTEGSYNTAVGFQALNDNTLGTQNTASGFQALFSNTEGNQNLANGYQALAFNSTGDNNTANGFQALFFNDTGNNNTATGYQALADNTSGEYNTADGLQALFSNTTGSTNTAIGPGALFHNTDGGGNTAIGANFVLYTNNHGSGNTAIGGFALATNGDGNYNTAYGWATLSNNVSGSFNTAIGVNAGQGITTASNVICIGKDVLGADVDNSCYIGNIIGSTIDPGTAAAVGVDATGKLGTVASSRRFKRDIEPMNKTSEAILSLKPVTFHYKSDPKNTACFGLVAEEVAKVNRDLVVRDKNGEIYSVRYDAVNAMLLNEFLKEHRKVQEQETTIAQMKKGMDALVAHVKEQDSKIQKVSDRIGIEKATTKVVVNNP